MSQSPDHASAEKAVRTGFICAIAAYTLWGLFPAYFQFLDNVPAIEILAHRIVWSVPFGALLLTMRQQWPEVKRAFTDKQVVMMLAIAAVTIAVNWLVYVWAVSHERILEASLGYYINPLMYVAAGVFVLGEKLRRLQLIAVALASVGVLVLTLGADTFPWVSIVLAISFTMYGYIRKTTSVGAMPGLFIEVVLLSPLALIYLVWLWRVGAANLGAAGLGDDALLVMLGPLTVTPLVLFALAARRLRLSTLGFLQYIGPTLQLVMGLVFGEPFTLAHAICFGLIWTALALFSVDAVGANRREKAAMITKDA